MYSSSTKTLCAAAAAAATSAQTAKDTLHKLRTRDITLRVPSKDRLVRVVFCGTRHLWRETLQRHNLWQSTSGHIPFLELLGTHMTFTNTLAALQEGEERIISRFTCDEATMTTEALALGECRCYVQPEYNEQIAEQGRKPFPLKVDRILYRQRQPFTSVVNADLKELVSCSPDEAALIAAHGSRRGEDVDVSCPPPLTLALDARSLQKEQEGLISCYTHNASLHGYNFIRRSSGSVPALCLQSHLDANVLRECPTDGPLSDDVLQRAVGDSFGLLVEPVAAGDRVDWSAWRLQRALTLAMSCPDAYPALQRTRELAREGHTTCQYMLSLVTGDYEGSHEAAVAARHFTEDPGVVAAAVEPHRKAMQIDDITIAMDGKEAVRTGLDFFCRCSTANILQTLVGVPEDTLQSLMAQNEFRCTFCSRVHHAKEEEWKHLLSVRQQQQQQS